METRTLGTIWIAAAGGLSALAVGGLLLFVGASTDGDSADIDIAGMVLLGIGGIAVQFALIAKAVEVGIRAARD